MIVAILPQGELLSELVKSLERAFPSHKTGLMPGGVGWSGSPMFNLHCEPIGSGVVDTMVEIYAKAFIAGWESKMGCAP